MDKKSLKSLILIVLAEIAALCILNAAIDAKQQNVDAVPQVIERTEPAAENSILPQYHTLTKEETEELREQYLKTHPEETVPVIEETKTEPEEEIIHNTVETPEQEEIIEEEITYHDVPWIQTMGNVTQDQVEAMYSAVTGFGDQQIIEDFIAVGGIFYVVDKPNMDIIEGPNCINAAGVFASDTPTPSIFMLNTVDANKYLPHELAHYVEYRLGLIADTPEFVTIYNEEAPKSGLIKYFRTWNYEFFAESYHQMLIDPEYAEKCPKTCAYLDRCLAMFWLLAENKQPVG